MVEIHSCGIEKIFTKENGIETSARVIFPKLTYLTLMNLKELEFLSKKVYLIMAIIEKIGTIQLWQGKDTVSTYRSRKWSLYPSSTTSLLGRKSMILVFL